MLCIMRMKYRVLVDTEFEQGCDFCESLIKGSSTSEVTSRLQ